MSRVSGAMVSDARPHLPTEGAANSGCLFASRATTQMSAIAPKPEGTGLSGRSALSRRSPVGPATGVASPELANEASHPGKPPLTNAAHLRGSAWSNFLRIVNAIWRCESAPTPIVLLGDAAHTAHFSVGSGTKLALE